MKFFKPQKKAMIQLQKEDVDKHVRAYVFLIVIRPVKVIVLKRAEKIVVLIVPEVLEEKKEVAPLVLQIAKVIVEADAVMYVRMAVFLLVVLVVEEDVLTVVLREIVFQFAQTMLVLWWQTKAETVAIVTLAA